jgi:hypothetical protein
MANRFIHLVTFAILLGIVGCGTSRRPQPVDDAKQEEGPKTEITAIEDPWRIIDKANRAMASPNKIGRWKAGKIKYREFYPMPAMDYVLCEETFQLPGQLKTVAHLKTKAGREGTIITVANKGKGWQRQTDGTTVEHEVKDADQPLHNFASMLFFDLGSFKPANATLAVTGEGTVDDRKVVIVQIQTGQARFSCYFEQDSGLLLRLTSVKSDPVTGMKETLETYFGDYKYVQGGWVPMRHRLLKEGKLFGDVTILELQFLDRVDEMEFEKP